MSYIKKTAIIVLFCMVAAFSFTGCSESIQTPTVSDHYDTQQRRSAVEYSFYISKQINVFANELQTRILAIQNHGTGSETKEQTLAENAKRIMQTARDEVYVTYPSTGSDSDREAVLTAMDTALNDMDDYIVTLKGGGDVTSYKKAFENDFNELTGLASLYYQ